MTDKQTTRRRFLVAAITFSTIAASTSSSLWLKSSAAWAEANDSLGDTLTRMAQLLFPHNGLSDDVYASVVGGILAATANDPTMTGVLDSAEAELDRISGEAWLGLDEDAQIEAMVMAQDGPLFAAILGTVRGHFYYNPAVWEHLNYPGPSKQLGGYINRGFNDLDWLPEGN